MKNKNNWIGFTVLAIIIIFIILFLFVKVTYDQSFMGDVNNYCISQGFEDSYISMTGFAVCKKITCFGEVCKTENFIVGLANDLNYFKRLDNLEKERCGVE